MVQQANINPSDCRKCGTCCIKGGPALHEEDRFLVDEGKIPAKYLYTLREGELAYDNVKKQLMPVKTDIIKVKGRDNTQACLFLNPADHQCRIYENRPGECRLLKCWDTREIEGYYDSSRLTRQQVLGDIKGLWEIIADHHMQCPIGPLKNFSDEFIASKPVNAALEKKVAYIIRYDISVRSLVQEKGNMDEAMLPFLFGRPITQIMAAMGVRVIHSKGKLAFKRSGIFNLNDRS